MFLCDKNLSLLTDCCSREDICISSLLEPKILKIIICSCLTNVDILKITGVTWKLPCMYKHMSLFFSSDKKRVLTKKCFLRSYHEYLLHKPWLIYAWTQKGWHKLCKFTPSFKLLWFIVKNRVFTVKMMYLQTFFCKICTYCKYISLTKVLSTNYGRESTETQQQKYSFPSKIMICGDLANLRGI